MSKFKFLFLTFKTDSVSTKSSIYRYISFNYTFYKSPVLSHTQCFQFSNVNLHLALPIFLLRSPSSSALELSKYQET